MRTDHSVIIADNASKLFLDGALVAFRQLSLCVRRDEIMCIVGPSGCATVAAMIEANRTIYRDKNKVVPIMAEAVKKPTVEQVANIKLAEEAVQLAGGRVTIGGCTESFSALPGWDAA